jgi:hypothetical protein
MIGEETMNKILLPVMLSLGVCLVLVGSISATPRMVLAEMFNNTG